MDREIESDISSNETEQHNNEHEAAIHHSPVDHAHEHTSESSSDAEQHDHHEIQH